MQISDIFSAYDARPENQNPIDKLDNAARIFLIAAQRGDMLLVPFSRRTFKEPSAPMVLNCMMLYCTGDGTASGALAFGQLSEPDETTPTYELLGAVADISKPIQDLIRLVNETLTKKVQENILYGAAIIAMRSIAEGADNAMRKRLIAEGLLQDEIYGVVTRLEDLPEQFTSLRDHLRSISTAD